jgi:hypothetical protein
VRKTQTTQIQSAPDVVVEFRAADRHWIVRRDGATRATSVNKSLSAA